MTQLCDCPFGFEDGHIVGYRAQQRRLEVDYEFWNEKTGIFVFEEVVAVHDIGAIGAIVGSALQTSSSDLVVSVIRRIFDVSPESYEYKSFSFRDVDESTIYEVVAQSCSFVGM